jgi:hypothetical protein
VRPLDSIPTISVMAPTGNPPSSNASISLTPVGRIGRITRGAGVSAEGILRASIASIWSRIMAADGMLKIFALFSPNQAV